MGQLSKYGSYVSKFGLVKLVWLVKSVRLVKFVKRDKLVKLVKYKFRWLSS